MYYFLIKIRKTLDSKHQNILNQILLDLRKEKRGFLNRILGLRGCTQPKKLLMPE
jgi:hypothetical protein